MTTSCYALGMGRRRRTELAETLFERLLGDLGDTATAIAVTAAQETLRRPDWSREGATFAWVLVPAAGWVVVPTLAAGAAAHESVALDVRSGSVALASFGLGTTLCVAAARVRAALGELYRRREAATSDASGYVFLLHVAPPRPDLGASAQAAGLPAQHLALLAHHGLAPPAPLRPAHDLAASMTLDAPPHAARSRRRTVQRPRHQPRRSRR